MSNLIPIDDIADKLNSINLDKLNPYIAKMSSIDDGFNRNLAPGMMRDFIVGQDVASVLLAKAVQAEMMAKSAVETAEAIATLDKADAYFASRGQKPTDKMRQAYVALDEDVKIAKDIHARACAIMVLLKNRVYELKSAYEAVRQLYKESNTNWEGM